VTTTFAMIRAGTVLVDVCWRHPARILDNRFRLLARLHIFVAVGRFYGFHQWWVGRNSQNRR
jgi:hypothetical protein